MSAVASEIPQTKDVEQFIPAMDAARNARREWKIAEAEALVKRRAYIVAAGVVRALMPDAPGQVLE